MHSGYKDLVVLGSKNKFLNPINISVSIPNLVVLGGKSRFARDAADSSAVPAVGDDHILL